MPEPPCQPQMLGGNLATGRSHDADLDLHVSHLS
jgi:hypothetical protein